MTRFPQLSRNRAWIIRGTVVLLFLTAHSQQPVQAFGGSGPYDHTVITQLALDRYMQERGVFVSPICQELIVQSTVVSDSSYHSGQDMYHCDNNNIAGCSYKLDELTLEARNSASSVEGLQRMGQALHIIQDFYSHSNWVEIMSISMILAPIEDFKDVPPPHDLQTGIYPDPLNLNPELGFLCLLTPESNWSHFIPGATHGCLNKDTRRSIRGATLVPLGGGMDFHRLAAEYAIRHTVKKFEEFEKTNGHFQICLGRPPVAALGCNIKKFHF
ncbi:MAG: hypothetical protein JNM27_14495 [Leptospirales bacterium]|nr:hypothetical protein [Leptospirales bacterium]